MRPQSNEFVPYYSKYVDRVPEEDVIAALEQQIETTRAALAPLSELQAMHRYEPDKWSVKEVVGHMVDVERVFAYRALSIARGEQKNLPDFDQNEYMKVAGFDTRSLADLVDEFTELRRADVRMFRALAPEAWSRIGTASDARISVRALAYVLVGHERHHLEVIRERYLNAT